MTEREEDILGVWNGMAGVGDIQPKSLRDKMRWDAVQSQVWWGAARRRGRDCVRWVVESRKSSNLNRGIGFGFWIWDKVGKGSSSTCAPVGQVTKLAEMGREERLVGALGLVEPREVTAHALAIPEQCKDKKQPHACRYDEQDSLSRSGCIKYST